MNTVSFDSPYYPYEKVQSGYNGMSGAEKIPLIILKYLLDLPDKSGYVPVNDNVRPRVRFAKYLCNDGKLPLAKKLPSPEVKLSILFDPDNPVINADDEKKDHPLGYRLFAQPYIGQSQLEATTFVKCYIGRVIPVTAYHERISLVFEIWANVNYDTNTKTDAFNRAFNIEQAIVEALHGVNIAGVGVVSYDRGANPDCGSRPVHDEGTNVGRLLTMNVSWMETTNQNTY